MAAKNPKTKAAGTFQYDTTASTNPTRLKYPGDPYGLCSELRKAMVKLSGRLRGDHKKLAVVEKNLAVLIGHMYNKFNSMSVPAPVAMDDIPEPIAPAAEPAADVTAEYAAPAMPTAPTK